MLPFVALLLLIPLATACDIDLAGAWDMQQAPPGSWPDGAPAAEWAPQDIPAGKLPAPQGVANDEREGVWLRRRFDMPLDGAGPDAALVWESVRWGFRASLNGTDLGTVELYGPGSLRIPPGTLRAAGNELLLLVRGWKRVPRGNGGEVLFPIGAARFGWGDRTPWVQGRIGIDLYHGTRLRAALIDGDPRAGTVRAILRCDGDPPPGARAELSVRDEGGRELGSATGPAGAVLTASCPGLPAWSPEQPTLCTATVTLRAADGGELDRREERFGARVLSVDGRLRLDGRPLTLLGTNLVNEWRRMDPQTLRRYLVDDARRMHAGGFRTHTLPPPHAVAELCDRTGQWLLAEMPATYNGVPDALDEAGERTWRANAEAMFTAWCEALHNHPSIVGWVPINEPPMDAPFDLQGWIHGRLIPAVRAASPGRPVLSAWGSTDEVDDLHIYAGFWGGHEDQFREVAERHAAGHRPGRILANTEYIEGFTGGRIYRWTGGEDATSEAAQLRYAAIGAAQTEAMRSLDYGLILPYMFGFWNRGQWRPDAPSPMFAALRSALSPVAVAWEPMGRNRRAGEVLEAVVTVCNDRVEAATGTLEIRLAERDSCWRTDELVGEPLRRQEVTVPPGGRLRVPVSLTLPDSGSARILVASLGTSLSERPLRMLRPQSLPSLRVRVVGAPAAAVAGLQRLGLQAVAGIDPARYDIDADVVVVWEDAAVEASARSSAGQLNAWLHRGGRMLIMRQRAWGDTNDWTAFPRLPGGGLLTFTTEPDEASTVWRAGEGPLWRGLEPAHLDGWNGREGALVREALVAPWAPDGAPVTQNASGWMPSVDRAVIVAAGGGATWPADHADPRFVVAGGPRRFSHVRGTPLLLCTRTPPPSGAYTVRLPFTAAAMTTRVQAFEHGRKGSSPFRWRIDDGAWQEAGTDRPCHHLARVSQEANVWFGWSELGRADLAAGAHELELAVTGPAADGTWLLALDALLLTPLVESRTLAWSGGRRPAIIEVPCGAGRVRFAQLLFAGRLDPQSPDFDPAAARLFGNLLAP